MMKSITTCFIYYTYKKSKRKPIVDRILRVSEKPSEIQGVTDRGPIKVPNLQNEIMIAFGSFLFTDAIPF